MSQSLSQPNGAVHHPLGDALRGFQRYGATAGWRRSGERARRGQSPLRHRARSRVRGLPAVRLRCARSHSRPPGATTSRRSRHRRPHHQPRSLAQPAWNPDGRPPLPPTPKSAARFTAYAEFGCSVSYLGSLFVNERNTRNAVRLPTKQIGIITTSATTPVRNPPVKLSNGRGRGCGNQTVMIMIQK